ncbi:MAG: hypothetical protein HYW78_00115 [Parcubacteria group bacterium]|nr:hypothetical protein [Parcubacteria group bacterium]
MKKIILVFLLCVLSLRKSQAQDITIEDEEFQPKGKFQFGAALRVPGENDNTYQFRSANLNSYFEPKSYLKVRLGYDLIEGKLKYGYAKYSKEKYGGEFAVLGGAFLSPIAYIFSATRGAYVTQAPRMLDMLSVYTQGVSAQFKNDQWAFRVAHFNPNIFSAVVSYKGISIFFEEQKGIGGFFETMRAIADEPFINFSIGFFPRQLFVQNYIRFGEQIRLYGRVEVDDLVLRTVKGRTASFDFATPSWLAGVAWKYNDNFLLKAYYSTEQKASVDIVFFFDKDIGL